MWPSHPTHLSGKLVITSEIDGETSANIVRRNTGDIAGFYFDDTTPHDAHWITIGIAKVKGTDLQLFCAIAPTPNEQTRGRKHRPIPPCRNMLEIYPDHAGVPSSAFFPFRRDYGDIIVQHAYPGMATQWLPEPPPAPTVARAAQLLTDALEAVHGNRDRVWLF